MLYSFKAKPENFGFINIKIMLNKINNLLINVHLWYIYVENAVF